MGNPASKNKKTKANPQLTVGQETGGEDAAGQGQRQPSSALRGRTVSRVSGSWGAGFCGSPPKAVLATLAISASTMSAEVVFSSRTRLTCSWMPPPGGGRSCGGKSPSMAGSTASIRQVAGEGGSATLRWRLSGLPTLCWQQQVRHHVLWWRDHPEGL